MESNPQERRSYIRVQLLAYGQGKRCTLEIAGVRHQADLIDISAGGARLKLMQSLAASNAKTLLFSVLDVQDDGLLQKIPATTRWYTGQEIGIQFVQELDTAVTTLQRMVG